MSGVIDVLKWIGDAIPWPMLWLGACLGHAFWMTVGLNALYAWPLPRRVLKVTRKVDILLILSAPLLFTISLDLFDTRRLFWHESGLRPLLAPYTVVCFLLGTIVGPICQIRYWLRKTAPQQTSVRSHVVDVAVELGFEPRGHGKDHRTCGLPGNQCFQVEFTEKTLTLARIPAAWDGLSILHLTDLHFCGTPDRTFYQHVFDHALRDGVPDLIALTGDVTDSPWHHRWIVPLLGRLRSAESAWAILGNHDYYYSDPNLARRRLRKIGFNVLENSWKQVTVRGEPLVVIGHEGPWLTPTPQVSGMPEHVFRLLLSHSPDPIGWAQRHKIDLMLAGHVHGGQIRLPIIGSTFCPSRYSRRYDCGTFFEPPTVLHVSRGLAGQHPLRFNCRPEMTRVILRKQS